jgi:uncharacterized protein involved in exopolysaccharide biosynthesis
MAVLIKLWRWFRHGLGPDGRPQRYSGTVGLLLLGIWSLVIAYCILAPASYTSRYSLVLPGAGVAATVTLEDIGQASSATASPYSSSSLSPTEKYKRLMMSELTLSIAADKAGVALEGFPEPRVTLVDQTELIHVEMTAGTVQAAHDYADALYEAFTTELNRLRADETRGREQMQRALVGELQAKVDAARQAVIDLQMEGAIASTNQYAATIDSLERLQERLLAVNASLAQADATVDRLSNTLGIDVHAASRAFILRSDPQFQDLLARYTRLAGEMREIAGRLGDRHPRRVALQADYAAVSTALQRRGFELSGLADGTILRLVDLSVSDQRAALFEMLLAREAERAGLAAEAAVLEQQIGSQQARVVGLAENAAELERLNKELQVAEAVFSSALARLDVTKADYFVSYPMVQVLEPATWPERPSGPKRKLAIAGGVVASLMVLMTLLLAWLREPILDLVAEQLKGRAPAADAAPAPVGA